MTGVRGAKPSHLGLRLLAFGVSFVVVAEVVFRLLIPASMDPVPYFDESSNLYTYRRGDSGVFRRGRFSQIRVPWRINDAGCNAYEDYNTETYDDFHRIVLIGDSYIEALYVQQHEHFAVQLQDRDTQSKTKVFAIGLGARPFSEHAAVARATKRYAPQTIMCFLTHGDIYISLTQFRRQARSHQLTIRGEDVVEVGPDPRSAQLGWLGDLVRGSAFARYLVWGRGYVPHRMPVESKDLSGIDQLLPLVCDHVVGQLVEQNPAAKIVFVVDANRRQIQKRPVECPVSLPAVEMIRAVSASYPERVYVCDLNQHFYSDFMAAGKLFSHSGVGHWNEYANGLAADYVSRFLIANGLVPEK